MSQACPQLFLVHCVDTEGPLSESLEATFTRLRENKGIDLPPAAATLQALQNSELDLGGREAEVADYLHPKRLAYLTDWTAVGQMLQRITSPDFRMLHADPFGNPYTFSWFIIDIVGYNNNPRNKSTGFHSVWDNFHQHVPERHQDCIGWHFHTVPANQNAIEYNTCWTNNDWHEQALCRRLIERGHFPSLFRAGGHIERNDLSYWLEQFIPFDFSCRSYDPQCGTNYAPGAINDWRGAPYDWSSYQPCFYDYRRPGHMRRHIFRTLDIDSNACQLGPYEVEKAFARAQHEPTILAISTHDRRDMGPEIAHVMQLMQAAAVKYPEVQWAHSNALQAAQRGLSLTTGSAPKLTINVTDDLIDIRTDKAIFGPQPFLALQEGGLFYRDNLTQENSQHWVYQIPRAKQLTRFGVACNSPTGLTSTAVHSFDTVATC